MVTSTCAADFQTAARFAWGLGSILGCAVILSAGCASLGQNAGVSIEAQESGQGSTVDVRWTREHPWAGKFQAQAARFHLFAQYRSGEQPVEQDLGAAAPFGADAIRFRLPRTLRSVPDSAICMFVSEARAASAVPVRLSAEAGGDTARFRNPEWETGVRTRTLQAQLDKEDAALEQSIREAEGELRKLQALQASTGVASIEGCRSTTAPAAGSANLVPPNVVEPSRVAATTERICVRRAQNMPFVHIDQFVEQSAGGAIQTQRFLQQWARWSERVGADYSPEIGLETDSLPLAPTLREAIKNWIRAEESRTATNARIIALGLLDGYDGCLEDVEKQLRIKYEAWHRALANKSERDRLYEQWQESTCRNRLEAQAKAQDAWSQTMMEARNRKAAVQLKRNELQIPAAGIGSDRKILNQEYCAI